jgi:dienelactone hydrolase
MDHLGIQKFTALGFCIGGPFIWTLLRRAPEFVKQRPEITMEASTNFLPIGNRSLPNQPREDRMRRLPGFS